MPIVTLKLPVLQTGKNPRAAKCPFCQSSIVQRWGSVERKVQDLNFDSINIFRFRCNQCGRTFREYPPGIDPNLHSSRLRDLAAVMCGLGMSYRQVASFFDSLGVQISRMTIWRDWQKMLEKIRGRDSSEPLEKYFIDRVYLHNISTKLGVSVAVDFGEGTVIALGTLNECNPQLVKSWLNLLTSETGIHVSILGTDSLDDYYGSSPDPRLEPSSG